MLRRSAAAMLAACGPLFISGVGHAAPVEITFASGPDDSGTVRRMVESFNKANEGSISVTWRVMPEAGDAHRDAVISSLKSGSGDLDVIATDVVWTAELARNDWLVDVTRRFNRDYERAAFLEPALQTTSDRLRVYGVPWYTDAGLLFYRKDLLAAHGFSSPPSTWDELAAQSRKIQGAGDAQHGFVFQGAVYEGGAVNAAEFIWSAGGAIMTSEPQVTGLVVNSVREVDVVRIDSPQAAAGLDRARQLIVSGVAPAEVADYREKEALDVFASGNAVFLRGWPYVERTLRTRGFSADQIGLAPLPAVEGEARAGCLGGWNLAIASSASRAEQDAAWTFIRYVTDPAQQRAFALQAGNLPTLKALYDDPALQSEVPAVSLGKQLFARQLRVRPKSLFYGEMSDLIAGAFHRVLQGEITGEQAVESLDDALRAVKIRNR